MEKIERDGMIAVLVSPGYGAGWSTWADEDQKEALCMDARIVGPFLEEGNRAAAEAALKLFPNVYIGGADHLVVEWLPKGTQFEVEEYDGYESLHVIGSRVYMEA